jgi:glutathione synthase/RimK-type ligase-like ATP-grasp enzyme
MFEGRSIRAGQKVSITERDGRRITPHQWIRSFDAGWIIRYEGFESTEAMRRLAKSAVEALGLNFGAVDIGQKADGSLIVFEVNRAPGIEGTSLQAYATKIIAWLNGTLERPRNRRS